MGDTKQVLALARLDLTSTGKAGPSGKTIVMPRVSCFRHSGLRVYSTITPISQMVNTSFNGTARQPFAFDKGAFDLARNFIFRFRIDVTTSSVRLVPTFYWNQVITITSLGGPGSPEIQRFYPEALLALYAAMGVDYIESMAEAIGFNPKSLWLGRQVAAGESVYCYLPIPAWYMFGQAGWNGKIDQSGQIQVDFFPIGSIISSGSGSVSLGEAVLLLDTDRGAPGDYQSQENAITKYSLGSHYLSSEPANIQPQTLTAGATIPFNLQNLTHKSAAILVGFLASTTSNAGNATQQYQSLGDSYGTTTPGTLDITDPAGKSIWSGGTALPAHHLKTMLGSRFFCGAFNRFVSLYPVIFSADLKAAIGAGQIDDYFGFNGSSYQLSVRFPPAGTQEQHTVTQSGTPASGAYKLGWTSTATGLTCFTNDLAYNTSNTNMATAFNALESVIQDRLVVSFNQGASAGAAYIANFADVGGQYCDLKGNIIQVIANTMATSAPAVVTVSVARTTQGVWGWVTGVYTPVVISLYWKMMTKYSQGGSGLVRITDV